MLIDKKLTPKMLLKNIQPIFIAAAKKSRSLDRSWNTTKGTPVFTVEGQYTSRGWTEWTQGFQYGCLILAGDALDDRKLIELGRKRTIERMLPHVTHVGVHDHGFNNLSTYGNLLRLLNEKKLPANQWERETYRTAIAASGAVQAARWSPANVQGVGEGEGGYIYSFNGPHSLFVDTMRTIRVLGVAHQLGHVLMGENDQKINLLGRLIKHAITTHHSIVFHGDSSHTYDLRGRTAHEAVFNRNDGNFRCRSSQQGYSPFSTWTRGLAWAMLGYAEQLEFLNTLDASEIKLASGLTKKQVMGLFKTSAIDTCDHYINDVSCRDGITYWDDGAPGLGKLEQWRERDADPYNDHEPVDSTASVIAAQGLIRLGNYLAGKQGERYLQAGLTIAQRLFDSPYFSTSAKHQGLLLHSIYHQPNGWDHIPAGQKVPCGESSMWGDYHLLELANLIKRMAESGKYPTFYS